MIVLSRLERLAAVVLLAMGFYVGGAAGSAAPSPQVNASVRHHQVVVVHGCRAEDDCRVDFHHNGTWTIRRVKH